MDNKFKKLKSLLNNMGSVLLAYSGGVDSTFLLKIAKDTIKGNVLAVTSSSPAFPAEELTFSKKMAKALGVRHKIIQTRELLNKNFSSNSSERCYFCKREIFSRLREIAKREKIKFVIDASNLSDKDDFRPGDKAKRELNIRSPLQEAGFSKEDVRKLSRKLGLITWNKPSLACLASRIPYGMRISSEVLKRVSQAELFLKKLGFHQVRLRHYGRLCRIELFKKDLPAAVDKAGLIVKELKKRGYNYVTLDLQGYRQGSMNEGIKRE